MFVAVEARQVSFFASLVHLEVWGKRLGIIESVRVVGKAAETAEYLERSWEIRGHAWRVDVLRPTIDPNIDGPVRSPRPEYFRSPPQER